MKCVICKTGETAPGKATLTFEKNESTIVIKDVPARVCQNCGEEYVNEQDTEHILSRSKKLSTEGVQFEIRTYESEPASAS